MSRLRSNVSLYSDLNTHKCASAAKKIINKLHPKFNPNASPRKDNLTLTHRRREKNTRAIVNRHGEIIFDPTVTAKTSLSECFRIFAKSTQTQAPAYRLQHPSIRRCTGNDLLTVYTDGSCVMNGRADARCGSGIWIADNHPLNKSLRIPGPSQSNQIGKIAAILVALQSINPLTPIKFVTDSKYLIDGLTTHLQRWEDTGWIGIANSTYFRATAYHLRKRSAPTSFQWVKGHSGIQGNEEADRLATQGAEKEQADHIDLSIPPNFDLQGAKLASITQRTAYQGLLSSMNLDYQESTLNLLDTTRYSIQSLTNSLMTDAAIWNGCRNPDLSKKIQQFLFKTLHNTHRIGSFWLRVRNYEERARCSACNTNVETMEHILFNCDDPTNNIIWTATKDLWLRTGSSDWPTMSIGLLLGCGVLHVPHTQEDDNTDNQDSERYKQGASRLLRILISESAYLIWTIRCERSIQGRTHTPDTIIKRWHNTLLRRLQLDRAIAASSRRNLKLTQLIHSTWNGIIRMNNPPQENWVINPEVLVGITLPRPPQPGVTR